MDIEDWEIMFNERLGREMECEDTVTHKKAEWSAFPQF